MDTNTFLKTVLPSSGVLFVARIARRAGRKDVTIHYPVSTPEDAAETALRLNAKHPESNIYYAMASYKEVIYKTATTKDGREFTYPTGRKQDNAQAVKCLWQDWDVGKNSPDSYATIQEAAAALKTYNKAVGLPAPIVVKSGYGLHSYWLFTDDISAAQWRLIASRQRIIMRHLSIKFDTTRDRDIASVLRPPGTHNRKVGKEDRLVQVAHEGGGALPAQEYLRLFRRYMDEHKLATDPKAEVIPDFAKGDDGELSVLKKEFPPSYAVIAVEHCQQLKDFSITGGESENVWHKSLGVLKHMEDGERYAYAWSAQHEEYDEDATRAKFDRWEAGPTTCEMFKQINPSACAGCPHKVKSPVQLGLDSTPDAPPKIAELAEQPPAPAPTAPAEDNADAIPVGWPTDRFGYDRKDNAVTMRVLDADTGVYNNLPIATPAFYPVEQIRVEDGTFEFRMHMWVRGAVREFQLPTKHIADTRSLSKELAARQIYVMNDKAVASYLNNYMINLQREREETNTYRQMGWHHDGKAFLIGDLLVTDQEERKVVISKLVGDAKVAHEKRGDKDFWIRAVDELYNRQHGEYSQFAICHAFAAPLHRLLGFDEWRGIPLAFTTDQSGYGKSTVHKIANAIWMRPAKAEISNSTPKAVLGAASYFNGIPYLLDETTKENFLGDPKEMGDILYALSNGQTRRGMTGGGVLRDALPDWCGSCVMTSNKNTYLQLSENKLNPEAQQMRVFLIDPSEYPRLASMDKAHPDYERLSKKHQMLTQDAMAHYGEIGVEYARFVIRNQTKIREKLRRVSSALARALGEDGDNTKERYYLHLMTVVLVGGSIAKKLGYINFDMTALKNWAVAHVDRMRCKIRETHYSSEENFSRMVADIFPRIIVTQRFDSLDARKGKTEMHYGQPLRAGICGRYVIGDEKERTRLYLTQSSIKDWCRNNGVDYSSFTRMMYNEGLFKLNGHKCNQSTGAVAVTISKGVVGIPNLGNPTCFEFAMDKLHHVIERLESAEIVQIRGPV